MEHLINLNFAPGGLPATVHVSQYDDTIRQLRFQLWFGRSKVEVPSGASVRVDIKKPDGHIVLVNGTVNSSDRSIVTVPTTKQMTAVPGGSRGTLVVSSTGDKRISSAIFILQVHRDPVEDGDASESDLSMLQDAIDQTAANASAAQAAATAAQQAASSFTTDTTLSVSGKAADAAETGRQFGLIKTDLQAKESSLKDTINASVDVSDYTWVIGTLNATTGKEQAGTTRIRSDYIPVSIGTVITLSGKSNCLIVYCYDEDKNYLAPATNWTDGNRFVVSATGTYYVRILIRKDSSNTTITSEEVSTLRSRCNISLILPQSVYSLANINTKINDTIKTRSGYVGFNVWDERWINYSVGTKYVMSKNFIPVIPDTDYYFQAPTNPAHGITFWDEDFTQLPGTVYTAGLFTTPASCAYIKFGMNDNYGTTYNNDICINISQPDTSIDPHNGQYVSYKYLGAYRDIVNIKRRTWNAEQLMLIETARKRFTLTKEDNYAANGLPTFVHVSDVHGDSVRFNNAVKIARKIHADAILNSGDSVKYNPSDSVAFLSASMAGESFPMLPLIGNHESYTYTEQQMYNTFIKPFETGLVLDTNVDYSTYYYRDFTGHKLRIIGVNQFQYRGVGNSTMQRHYTQEQIDFICNALLTAPDDYGIIIMMHTPEVQTVKSDGYGKFYQEESVVSENLGGTIKPIYEIVDAYISGVAFNKTYDNASGNTPSSFTVDVDFSEKNTSEFICYVSGHLHKDAIHYVPNTTNKQLVLNVICTNAWSHRNTSGTSGSNYPYYNELNDLPRVIDTVTEDALNVYSIDRTNKTIRIVRYGSCMPYNFDGKRDYMIIPYAD